MEKSLEQQIVKSRANSRNRGGALCIPLLFALSFIVVGQKAPPHLLNCFPQTPERVFVGTDPLTIVTELRSMSLVERAKGYKALFGDGPNREQWKFPAAVTLAYVPLNNNYEDAAILTIDVGGVRIAFVFVKERDGWWIIGKFDNEYRSPNISFDSMIEVSSIIDSTSGQDLIVRKWGYGTEVRSRTMNIFQLRKGSLRCVFSVLEEEENEARDGAGARSVYDRRIVSVPDREYAGGSILVVRHFRMRLTEAQSYAPEVNIGDAVDCGIYKWDSVFQSFQADKGLVGRFCGPSRMPSQPRIEKRLSGEHQIR